MKLRWHLLFILIAGSGAILFALAPRQPLWQIRDTRTVTFSGFDPVGQQWYVLATNSDKTEWHWETRKGAGSEVVRRLKLAVPSVKGRYHFVRSSPGTSDAPLVFIDTHDRYSGTSLVVEVRAWLLHPQTGELLRDVPIFTGSSGSLAMHGNRLAIAGFEGIHLFEGLSGVSRLVRLKSPRDVHFSTDGSLLVCSENTAHQLYTLDWDRAEAQLQPVKKEMYSIAFISPDVLLIYDADKVNRWKWDGRQFNPISPGIKADSSVWPLQYKIHRCGLLQVLASHGKMWPIQFDTFFTWLSKHQVPMERWFPKEENYRWRLIDEQDRVVQEFQEPRHTNGIKIYGDLVVELQPQKEGGTLLQLGSHSPTWPNALAVGVVIYLMLYVVMRCVQTMKPSIISTEGSSLSDSGG